MTAAGIQSAASYLKRAEERFAKRDYRDAAVYYRRAWELDPSLARPVLYIGDCYFHIGDLFLAVQFFREALLRNPDDYLAWMMLGNTYLRLGRPDLAARYSGQALSLNPSNPRLRETMQKLPQATPAIWRYFEEALVPTDRWTSLLEQQRTRDFLKDWAKISDKSWIPLCFFYREYLDPGRIEKLETALSGFVDDLGQASTPGGELPVFAEMAKAAMDAVQRFREAKRFLREFAGPPLPYRFGPTDGVGTLNAAKARCYLERRKVWQQHNVSGRGNDDQGHLRIRGMQVLELRLSTLDDDAPSESIMESFTFALSRAIAARDFDSAEALALGEMELTMLFCREGPVEYEMLSPLGTNVSKVAKDMNADDLLEAVSWLESARLSEDIVGVVKARGWHAESMLNALSVQDPTFYAMYAVDYSKAYDLAKKMILVSDMVPEHLGRFSLRAFYRLQVLASLVDVTEKLGLYEETIQAGARLDATVQEMGADWKVDLPPYPAMQMQLGLAHSPEQLQERTRPLVVRAYHAIGDDTNTAAALAESAPVRWASLLWRGHLAAKDCLSLIDDVRRKPGGLDSAVKFACMALALDDRRYREAGVQFTANRKLAEILNELGLARMEIIHWMRALAAAAEMGLPYNILYCLEALGSTLKAHDDHNGAEYFYRRAVNRIKDRNGLQKSMGTTRAAIAAQFHLAGLIKNESPHEARSLLHEAITAIETQREALEEDMHAARFGKAGAEIYAELIDLNINLLKNDAEAFEVLERSKMQALLDQFARRHFPDRRAHLAVTLAAVRAELAMS